MPDDKTYVRLGGLPWKAQTSSQASDAITQGNGRVISEQEAREGSQAWNDINYVNENWGAPGQLGMGLLSGVTLGLGPGALASSGLVDAGHIQAAETSPFYTIGDIAGTVAPAVLSGGESLLGKGLSYTPAGILESLGSGTERFVGSLLGDGAGVAGKAISTAGRMAARGAVDGAAISIGHTAGEQLLENVPLAAESLLAAGVDGALAGALIGGSVGTVGSLSSIALEKVGTGLKGAAGKYGEGVALKRLGLSAEESGGYAAEGITSNDLLKRSGEIVERGGSRLGESDAAVEQGIKKGAVKTSEMRNEVIDSFDKHSPLISPSVERVNAQIDGIVTAKYAGTVFQSEAEKIAEQYKANLNNLTSFQELHPVKVEAKPAPKNKDWYGPLNEKPGPVEGYEIMGGKFPTGELPTWKKWIQSRDLMEAELKNASKSNPAVNIRREILNVVDGEISSAMESAAATSETLKGLDLKYSALTLDEKIAKTLEQSMGRKVANKLMSSGTGLGISVEEGAYAGLMAANGNPAAALGFVAGKGILRLGKERLEPAIAQAVYDRSIGRTAANSQQAVKSTIRDSIKTFFKNSFKTTEKSGYVANSIQYRKPSKDGGLTRQKYEDSYSRTEQLLSANHQDKVRRYSEQLQSMGYNQLAMQLMLTNQRAVQYLSYNMPARQSMKGLSSLRNMPVSKVPTIQEYRFDRMIQGITKPLSILKDLNEGTLSRDKVNAMKYVYPEVHSQIVEEVSNEIYSMKMEGKALPMSKIAMLGIALDSAVDSTLTPEYVNAVQGSLASPTASEDPSQQSPGQPPVQSGFDQQQIQYSQSLMTPSQQVQG